MDCLETIELEQGVKAHLYVDPEPENPRTEWDHAGKMVCWHSRYDLGDKHSYQTSNDFLRDLAAAIWHRTRKIDFDDELTDEKCWDIICEDCVILPLNLYDHSGISMSTSREYPYNDQWDAGQVGWIYMDKPTMKKEGMSRRQALAYLLCEVETYDQYLTGEIYGYVVETPDDDNVDSCWGFFGLEHARKEAKSAAAYYVKEYADPERYLAEAI